MLNVIIPSALTLLTLIMAYIQYKFPFKDKDGKTTMAGRLFGSFVILSTIGIGYVVYASIILDMDNKAQKMRDRVHEDSVLSTLIANVNSQLKPLKLHLNDKKQLIHDTVNIQNGNPLIYLCEYLVTKHIRGAKNDSIFYKIKFCNDSQFDAYNVTIDFYGYFPMNIKIIDQPRDKISKNFVIPKGSWISISNSALVSKNFVVDTAVVYIYVKGSYDREKYRNIDYLLDWRLNKDEIHIASPEMKEEILKKMTLLHLIK